MKKKIAVIGAGASGLVSARRSLADGHAVTVYEQQSELGGVWFYSPDPTGYSAMYEKMITNMPKQLMEFEDLPWPDEAPAFLTGKQIQDYLKSYAEDIPIEFGVTVVRMEEDKGGEGKWKLTISRKNGTLETHYYDVVFVCAGHHREPGNHVDFSNYQGPHIHSHDYRNANNYKDQIVAIVGTSYSGIDIVLQLAETAKKVYFIGSKNWAGLPKNVEFIEGQVTGTSSTSLVLNSGKEVSGMDTVIDCTGYRHNFPFLEENLIQINHKGKVVEPIWMYVVHMLHPTTLFFLGLNDWALTFPLYEQQVKFCLALIAGRATPVSREEMNKWKEERIRHLETEGRPLYQFYYIEREQYDYMREIAKIGGYPLAKKMKLWEKLGPFMEDIRPVNLAGYKSMKIHANGDEFHASF